MKFAQAKRLEVLPPYLFAEIDRIKQKLIQSGKKLISLGIGDPDQPTPGFIIECARKEINNPVHHRYPSYQGMTSYRVAVANWYARRFNVKLDPENEVVALIGSKEGIAHIPLAFVNPGEIVLCPDPGYPVYKIATIFAGGKPYIMPLKEENGFLPEFKKIPSRILNKAKLMFLNYPNNPTSATATLDFFSDVVKIAQKYNIAICHDNAYSEMYYDNKPQPSFLQVEGAKDVGIEFHSLSKTYNMTGWRVGFACGNKDLINGLGKIKENVDSGLFQAIQAAGVEALNSDQSCVEQSRMMYQERRDIFCRGLDEMGWKYFANKATFYVWVHTPKGISSLDMTMKLMNEAGIVSTPGSGFGDFGEGYIRFSLTVDKEVLKEVIEKFKAVKF